MGATEFAPEICMRYQTDELAVDSTEFGTSGSEETSSRLSLDIESALPAQELASCEL